MTVAAADGPLHSAASCCRGARPIRGHGPINTSAGARARNLAFVFHNGDDNNNNNMGVKNYVERVPRIRACASLQLTAQ